MTRSVAKLLSLLVCVLMAVAMLICEVTGSSEAGVLILLAGLVVLAVLSRYLRCPSCGRMPLKGAIFCRYCPYCGEDLDFE